MCARVGGLGALELAQSKRRRAHTNTCELQTLSEHTGHSTGRPAAGRFGRGQWSDFGWNQL